MKKAQYESDLAAFKRRERMKAAKAQHERSLQEEREVGWGPCALTGGRVFWCVRAWRCVCEWRG